jgi:glycosyltransferase involved in cell wall biosynthesis
VLPAIKARIPAARLVIAGSHPPTSVQQLADATVSVRANVSDAELRELYRTARVAVVPLRYGAGVKLKSVEALREGLPLITTSIGAQGLPGLELVAVIRDDRQEFADAVCQLLSDGIAWAECSTAQVEYAAVRFSEAAFCDSLTQALAQSTSRCATRLVS